MTFNYNGLILSNHFGMPNEFRTNGCNGAGSGWNAKIIPDTIYGLSIRIAACIHDYAYLVGQTKEDKSMADNEFLNNLLAIINNHKKWYYPHFLARHRATTYFDAVVRFGGTAFWEGKND